MNDVKKQARSLESTFGRRGRVLAITIWMLETPSKGGQTKGIWLEGLSAPKRSKPLGFLIKAQHICEAFVIDSVNQNGEVRAKFLPQII